jgi:hypothetical protein
MSLDAWIADQELRAEKVRLFRDYVDGDHHASLTPEMRALLRIGYTPGDARDLNSHFYSTNTDAPFNLNRVDNVIQTVVDRLEVTRIEDTSGAANSWIEELLDNNRFDALQIAVHEAAIRDADTFLLVDFDNERQQVRLNHEPAYDGVAGILVLYEKRSRSEITAAVKIWHITSAGGDIADTLRVNVYYPDRIEKFIAQNGQSLRPHADESTDARGVARWLMPDGTPIGIPVVHFKNRAADFDNYGRSEIDNAIPLQDALNRMLHSMIASAELGGFPVRVAKGFQPPAGLTPGAWVVVGGSGLTKDEVADASVMEQGEISPFLEAAQFLIKQIDEITRTPNAEQSASSTASGEALKQREIGLLGKVKRAQISFGNAWEDAVTLAHRVQSAFGAPPPQYKYFSAQWRNPEIRNSKDLIDNALKLRSLIGDEAALRIVASEFGWNETEIEKMLEQRRAQAQAELAAQQAQQTSLQQKTQITQKPA